MQTIDAGRLLSCSLGAILAALPLISVAEKLDDTASVEIGRQIYMEGVLPSGQLVVGTVSGDVGIAGNHVICGNCHRRSGLGSIEGTSVVPVVAGSVLFEDLVLPTSRPPKPPILRQAYTKETLARAIREGIGSGGQAFSSLMPRYDLPDDVMNGLIGYLNSLSTGPSPGVTDRDIHFATILTDTVPEASRTALLDVMQTFFEQKNSETRHESSSTAIRPTRGRDSKR